MRFSIRAGHDAARPALDVTLGTVTADATVAELLDMAVPLGHPDLRPGSGPEPAVVVDLDGGPVTADTPLLDLPLHTGSVLTVGPAGAGPGEGPVVELRRIAGPDSGCTAGLAPGTFVAAPRGDTGPVLSLAVTADGDCTVSAAGDEPVRVDGRPLGPGDAVAVAGGSVVVAAGAAFRVAPATGTASGRWATGRGGEFDRAGRRPLIRTPRVASPPPSGAVTLPDPPAPPTAPVPLSWLVLLAPVPVGIVMALVFSPLFLLMTTMSPCMGLARWVEGKHRTRKDRARMATETAEAAAAFAAAVERARTEVAAAERHAHADLGELAQRARTGRRLWEVRPGDPDHLQVALGIGPRPWGPELRGRGDALAAQPHLAEAVATRDRLDDVPVLADLRERCGIGVVGPDDAARPVVAAVVLDLVTHHGPADLRLALLVEPHRLAAWDWAKWLPHLGTDAGTPRLATAAGPAADLLAELDAEPAGGAPVAVVVDGESLLTGPVASRLGRLARAGGRALVVAGRPERLPSVCHSLIELDGDGTATVTDAATGARTAGLLAAQAPPGCGAAIARALAQWTDPEQPAGATALADHARLVDVLRSAVGPDGRGRPAGALDATVIGTWWRRHGDGGGGLPATVGVTEHGPLTLDLLADGPHGLVVGTTGAGKSEFLRSLVAALACRCSPDELTFLLVDFKGGGAFDACAGLPHTVGLVSDLDEHLAARALRCLRAELRHRERRLRAAGVSDLRDLAAPSPPLPRLVIVIDEFATLAAELPGFLSALVDVAQRGRSLGIHLVLATQRPQGVVDSKIRANTNLRVALRVQDEADSRDVLGTRHAADIDRRRPGRAFVRLGAGEVVGLQTAHVSAPARGARHTTRLEVAPFSLAPGDEDAAVAEPVDDGTRTDLEELLAAITEATRIGGYEAPRVPWPAPLPAELDAWSLPDDPAGEAGAAALGIVDLPDEQRADVWWWRPEAGGTLLLGADAGSVGAALATAGLALARSRRPDRQRIVVLDGSGHGLGALAALPHVTAAVGVDDGERLARVLDGIDAEVARRRSAPAAGPPGPEVLVIIAGWGAVVEGAERAGSPDPAARLERLLRDGGTVGVRLLISAAHERGVPSRLLAQLPTKLVLRLADATCYTALGLRARDVPDLQGLRAVELSGGHELHLGRYGDGTAASLAAEVARVAARYPDAAPTPEVGVLPEIVPAAEVVAASGVAGTTWRLAVGRRYRDLGVATVDLAPRMHVVVAGPPRSGRTTALRLLAAAARSALPAVTIRVVAADPDAWDAPPGEVVASFEELAGWPAGDAGLLLVDGVEALGPGAGTALDRLLPALPAGAHVAVAGRVEAFRGLQPWQRALTSSRTGLLLRPDRDDGDILRVRLPRDASLRPLPGRGYLVEAGELIQVQVARPPAAAPAAASTAAPVAAGSWR